MPVLVFETTWGACELHFNEAGVTGFRLPEAEKRSTSRDEQSPAPDWVRALADKVCAHLQDGRQDFSDVPYVWDGVGPFPRAVYQALLQVKPGHTATYGELAARIGQPLAASRAVGVALGQNPWPLLVPCHRCVGAGGRMVGFSGPGGVKTKLRLLALEGAELLAEG